MTSAELSDARHLHPMDNPSDRLTPLRQEHAGLTTENGDGADLGPEPKFLGFCCGPAISCCCGCSLQFALKAFATVALVVGVLGLMSSLVTIGLSDFWSSLESLAKCGLLLALGICLWNTAGDVSPKWADLSSYSLLFLYIMDVISFILTIIVITSADFRNRVAKNFYDDAERHHKPEPSASQVEKSTKVYIDTLAGTFLSGIILEGILFLFVFYFIWSFVVRAKRGEYFLITFGPHTLPTFAAHPATPQYGAYHAQPPVYPPIYQPHFNQQQQQYPTPAYPSAPQYYMPVQGSQMQQHQHPAMQQPAPHLQPPPQ